MVREEATFGLSWFSCRSSILVELEFGDVFVEGRKPVNPESCSPLLYLTKREPYFSDQPARQIDKQKDRQTDRQTDRQSRWGNSDLGLSLENVI